MTLDLSSSTEPRIGAVARLLAEVRTAIAHLSTPLMVIGATARDIMSVALVGAPPGRATADVDLAVAVPSWEAYDAIAAALPRVGRREHTFDLGGMPLDVVPFGGIEAPSRTIRWRDDTVMSTFGLRETHAAGQRAILPGGTTTTVPTLAGLTLLKMMAWTDRRLDTRRDAVDLQTIIGWSATGAALDSLYETDVPLLEAYEFDPDLAGAHRLGTQIAEVLGDGSSHLLAIFDDDALGRLAADMPRSVSDRRAILLALRAGVRGDA